MNFPNSVLSLLAASFVAYSKRHRKVLKSFLLAALLFCAFESECLAAATVSPTSLTWGSVSVGSAGGQKTATLTNTGSASITIRSIAITGTNAADFSIFSKTCGTSLAAAASCTAKIIFKPTTTGTRTAKLTFTDTASNSPQTVALSGAGTSVTVSLSPTSLAFGSVIIGSSGSSLSASLHNGTAASITISNVAIIGTNAADFTISSKTCGTSLAASASCSATIQFKPAATGTRTASLRFTDSASNSPQTVALSGTGTAATGSVTVSPTSLAFGNVVTGSGGSSLGETLHNSTAASITISNVAITGTNAADFTISSKTCGSSLAASASCTATILFKPAATGTRTATLSFTDSASNSPQTVALSGTGTTATGTGTITASPSSLAWGASNIGVQTTPQTVTLHNNATAAISISSIALTSTDPGDFTILSKTCGTTLGADASCTVTLALKPTATGTRVALLSATDAASNSPQTVTLSGTGAPTSAQAASIAVDFGSRSGTQVAIPYGVLAAQYLESLPDAASRSTVVNAGFRSSRLRVEIPTVFPTATTTSWNQLDGSIRALQAAGNHPILELVDTPTWLQPSPLLCPSSPLTSVPKDVNKWGQLAASIVGHLDKTFPNFVVDYEIWNEPNTAGLCQHQLNDYISIYAAAAPQMKAQSKTDGTLPIRVGGPASAGVAMPSLLTDSRTAPYVDFYSYHIYLAGPNEIKNGMTWDGAGGTPSLRSMVLNTSSGEQARFLQAFNTVKLAKTPLGAKTPIYFDEYNDDWSFGEDCCRNSLTYSPLFNGLTVAEIFNSVYAGASQVPSKMVYYAAGRVPFCLLGIVNANMSCSRTDSNGDPIAPYPQLYTYQMISATQYLDLVDGGHMASSITLSPAAKSQGLVATGFYTSTSNSILIINPTSLSFAGVTVQASNSGMTTPHATLFTVNSANTKLSSWPASLVPVTGGSQVKFDIPPYSVLGISIRNN